MDARLEQPWRNASCPFDGECLHLLDSVALAVLRASLTRIVDTLSARSTDSRPFIFDDWHEHDGYVTQSQETDRASLRRVLADDDSLYGSRQDDTYVRRAYYPEDTFFLMRYYVIDASEEPSRPGVWGDFDVCGSSGLIDEVRSVLPQELADVTAIASAKRRFDQIYAG